MFRERAHFRATCGKGNLWRGGLPLRRRGAIWHEDYARLAGERADVLVTHEAPSSHRHGFAEIAALASAMGAGLIVHGHLHEDYTATLPGGIRVIGVGLAGVASDAGEALVPGVVEQRR